MATRTDIRNEIVKALKTVPTFSNHVFAGRRRSIPRANLPACCVYIEDETKELDSIGRPRTFERQMTVVYEIYSAETSGSYDELDDLCAACEAALLLDETLGGYVEKILPASDQYEISEDGDHSGVFSESRAVVTYVE